MTGKRTNGEGTISKRKNGTYEGAVYVLMVGGHQKRVHVYGRTVQEVQEKLIAAKAQSMQGVPVADRSWTLAGYMDYWLENVARGNRRQSTRQNYVWVMERYLKPGLGSYRLEKLSVSLVQRWLDRVYAEGASCHRVRLLRTVLSTILTRAQREELVQRNVAHLVELPRYQAKERVPWSADEARRFLAAVVGDENRSLYLLLMMYGLRRGELLGLRWGDVDFEQGIIRVRNQLQRLGGEFAQGPVKTDAGNRDLPMLVNVRETLLELRARSLAVPRDLSPEALVFVTESGSPRDPDGFSKGFQHAAKRHGFRVIRVHDVRHTAATLLKDLGVPARDAQVILGHADIATTQQIYQHSTLETSEAALVKVEAALLSPKNQVQDVEVLDGDAYCRTVVVSKHKDNTSIGMFGVLLTSDNNWYTRRDSNPRPLVPEEQFSSLSERVAGVRRAAAVCGKQWILGAVVVKVVVRTEQFMAPRIGAATTGLGCPSSPEAILGEVSLLGNGLEDAKAGTATVERRR